MLSGVAWEEAAVVKESGREEDVHDASFAGKTRANGPEAQGQRQKIRKEEREATAAQGAMEVGGRNMSRDRVSLTTRRRKQG